METANLLNGRKPFQNVDYGLNLGLLLPLTIDGLKYSKNFSYYMAKKNNTLYLWRETTHSSISTYDLMENGDLWMNQTLHGFEQYYPTDDDYMYGGLYNRLFNSDRVREYNWEVDGLFISGYRNIIQTFYNFNRRIRW
jgi:hypothetical protein